MALFMSFRSLLYFLFLVKDSKSGLVSFIIQYYDLQIAKLIGLSSEVFQAPLRYHFKKLS